MTPVRVGPIARPGARVALALVATTALLMSLHIQAQTPTPSAARVATAADRLPVRRVVLYKSGVGYFEHLGRVRGNQAVTIDFTSGQLDDVLKSLTTLDLDGGRVSGVSYNSQASLDRRLGALQLPVGAETTRARFLSALRGAKVEVRAASGQIVGRLLSVEPLDRRAADGTTTHVDAISVVSDAGDIRTIPLDSGVTVHIVEADLNQEVGRYLSLIASVRDQDVRRLTIATTGSGDRDLFVSYVSEVPVWKATYRLVIPPAGEARSPILQGWAIVDNTVGEDWENVDLSLVAGAPQSFIQRVSQPYYVQRPIVPLPERALLSPQTHQGAIATAGSGALGGTVTDAGGGLMPGVTVQLLRDGAIVTQAVTNASGRYQVSNLQPGQYQISFTLQGFRTASRPGVVVSGGMETVVNMTMDVGTTNEVLAVGAENAKMADSVSLRVSGGGGGGRGGGFGSGAGVGGAIGGGAYTPSAAPMAPPRLDFMQAAQQSQADAAQLGDLFEYKLKERVTIRKNQSALVPIMSADVQLDKVSLWNASMPAGRPLRAVWITNSTGLTLDGGSFTVVEGQAFAGEGLLEPLKAGEKRLLSYAMDLGVQVDAKADPTPTRVTRVQILRGALIQQTEDRQRRTYTVRNDDTEPRVLVIEHPVRPGWVLAPGLTPAETTAAAYRFRVPVAPKTTATFPIEEVRAGQRQFALTSVTDDQVALFVRERSISPEIEAALRRVLAQKAEVARLAGEMSVRQNEMTQIGSDQERLRENMRSLKGSAEEKQLLQRYVKQLDDQENRMAALRQEIQTLTGQQKQAQDELNRMIEGMGVGD